MDVRQDLVYAYGWPSRIVRAIWRVKRAPKRAYASFRRFSCAIAHHFLGDPDSDFKNAKFFCGGPLRPWLCRWLAITASPTHFQGQSIPEAHNSFKQFLCAIANHFLGDLDSNVKNAKKFCGRLSRPWLCSQLAITASPTHFQGQTSPESRIPPYLDNLRVL